jgi:hypothetical protein
MVALNGTVTDLEQTKDDHSLFDKETNTAFDVDRIIVQHDSQHCAFISRFCIVYMHIDDPAMKHSIACAEESDCYVASVLILIVTTTTFRFDSEINCCLTRNTLLSIND